MRLRTKSLGLRTKGELKVYSERYECRYLREWLLMESDSYSRYTSGKQVLSMQPAFRDFVFFSFLWNYKNKLYKISRVRMTFREQDFLWKNAISTLWLIRNMPGKWEICLCPKQKKERNTKRKTVFNFHNL